PIRCSHDVRLCRLPLGVSQRPDSPGRPGPRVRLPDMQELESPDANLGGVDPKSAPRGIDLTKLTSAELLALFDGVLVELRARDLVRSSNNPVADYAESLVARALGLRLETKSTTGYDAIGQDGLKYEIKGRRPTPANKSRQL